MTISNLDNWCVLPTPMGDFRMYDSGDEDLRVVCFGDLHQQNPDPLVRLHSSCLASEVFGARDCDCADQLRASMKLIADEGRGLVIHLHQEGRGHGLSKKIEAVHTTQHEGLDTVEAFDALELEQDIRSYGKAVKLLRLLHVDAVRLISNNPAKTRYLNEHGFRVTRITLHPRVRPENLDYLKTKQTKLDHHILLESPVSDNGEVRFYHSDLTWGEFSNFSRHSVFLFGKIWPTVEHFYQAQKFAGSDHEESIRRHETPVLAKRQAQEVGHLCRHDWEKVKEEVMLTGLRAKFDQHPDLRERLLATNDRPLVEHTEYDHYWGDGGDATGMNRLGKLLMCVRAELKRPGEPAAKSS